MLSFKGEGKALPVRPFKKHFFTDGSLVLHVPCRVFSLCLNIFEGLKPTWKIFMSKVYHSSSFTVKNLSNIFGSSSFNFISAKFLFRWCILDKSFRKLYSQYCFYHNILGQTSFLENKPVQSAGKVFCKKVTLQRIVVQKIG